MAEIGDIEKRAYEEAEIEWSIADFFSITDYDASDRKYYMSSPFCFAGTPFFFELYPKNRSHSKSARLYVKSKGILHFPVAYSFGLKKLHGSLEKLGRGILKESKTRCTEPSDVDVSEMLRRKHDLVPSDILTVVCALKVETTHGAYSTQATDTLMHETAQATESDKPKTFKLIRLDKLSENFKDLFGDKDTCDTTLKVKDKEYRAHRLILMARSTVFHATFAHDTLERQTGIVTIPDCDPDSFQFFLDYLYKGWLDEIPYTIALNLYYISDKYDVEELKNFCVEYLIYSLTVESTCQIVVFANRHNEIKLFKAVQHFFNKNYIKILLTTEWDDLLAKDHQLANKQLARNVERSTES